MMSQDEQVGDRSGLNALSANASSADIKQYYDDWAGQYDRDLAAWNYEAPTVAANLLAGGVSADATILDVGCGTGLSGVALQLAGFQKITGVDISQSSLDLAHKTAAYLRLDQVDLHELPLSYGAAEFGGLQCVGVLSYVPDTEAILREFCRLVASGGLVVFSQRDDIYVERDYETVLQNLENGGACTLVSVSDPTPYLPENEEFGEILKVMYVVLQVS
ncbi:MAG: putative TPR repeat methyltransferase [Acidimicrobiales bacterium]|jgi:predicted TPR repeat methyltransferase